MLRLQKFLAEAGVASRRAGEQLIVAGKVAVNGQVVRELGTKVDPERDVVTVRGRVVRPLARQYLALHKPAGCVCSRRDERGRPTVYELLPPEWTNVQSVGRLDYDTEGLLLLTNDGELALRLTHPRYGAVKRYEVTVTGRVSPDQLAPFTRGIVHEGEQLRARRARLLFASKSRSILELELTEGKNREVRRMCAALGLMVERLLRTEVAGISLGNLRPGRWRKLTETELKSLLSRP
ncbi:MAG: pseudouridine synthase [Limisphaerales bacterium]